ncbi:MAG: membrane protein insertase YidC [Acidobacteriota bacterium]
MENRRLFLAALLSLGVIVLWQILFPPPVPVADPVSDGPAAEISVAEEQVVSPTPPSSAGLVSIPEGEKNDLNEENNFPEIVGVSERDVEIETATASIRFSNRGAQLVSYRLKDLLDERGEPLELVRQRADDQPFPFALFSADGLPLPLNEALFVVDQTGDRVTFEYSGPLGRAKKSFAFTGATFGVELELPGTSGWATYVGPGVRNPLAEELDDRFKPRYATYEAAGDMEDVNAAKLDREQLLPTDALRWVGLDDNYFITALIPRSPLLEVKARPVEILVEEERVTGHRPVTEQSELLDAELLLAPAGDRLALDAYFGAKKYTQLRRIDVGIEDSVRFGFFGVISRPLLYGLNWLHDRVVANYGWCIVLMTLLLRLALLPLTHKSYTSMQKMQKLNPRMESIRAKYRSKLKDKQGRPNLEAQRKMNDEMQLLFREEGVNPISGCLPILVQMPVFFGFYRLLANAVELWDAPWIGWIQNLAIPDPYFVLPLVMGATQFVSMRMTPAMPNPTQRFIMNSMPIWFTIFSFGFPSGLVLYWFTNNILTIVQQGGYNRLKKSGFFGGEEPQTPAKTRSAKS